MSLKEFGRKVRRAREQVQLSQEKLARDIQTNRSVIAHLEQGRAIPSEDLLALLCDCLGILASEWEGLFDPRKRLHLAFEASLEELVGGPCRTDVHDPASVEVARTRIEQLFASVCTESQIHTRFSALLTFYGLETPSSAFLQSFFPVESFKNLTSFRHAVEHYQSRAIRTASSFAEAYKRYMSSTSAEELERTESEASLEDYRHRAPFVEIERIAPERLRDLGYIAAGQVRKEEAERRALVDFLRELADGTEHQPNGALLKFAERKRRRMSGLLRRLGSTLEHDFMSPLFPPDADALRREAARLAPKDPGDLDQIASTQAIGQRNLARYLASDFLDVYLATSMRDEEDFLSVNRFAERLFSHPDVAPLHLRYFDPTLSWISDRVAKGLVEALMLRRCRVAIYMAQKSDTFGKDSEASVALGQGKSVLVYVPALRSSDREIDAERLWAKSDDELRGILKTLDASNESLWFEEATDHEAMVGHCLTLQLRILSPLALGALVESHWCDFGLSAEAHRVPENLRPAYRELIDHVRGSGVSGPVGADLCEPVIGVLVAMAIKYEKRALTFRKYHPLALQVILRSGVLNGIIVARSVESCATLLAQLLSNSLDLEFLVDENAYQLVERTTGSTIRVISRHTLVANAYSRTHLEEGQPPRRH